MSAPTPIPWSVARSGGSIWIHGQNESGANPSFLGDRRIVCEFKLYGDKELDAETEANFALIVERVNSGW